MVMKRAVKSVMAGVTAAWLLAAPGLAQDRLPTVASLNVCTDQLAMALAAPGQLKSVSALAHDPMLSAMPEEAKAYPVNRGLAEEVFTLKPDLVVTGTFSLHNTTGLLRRLGFRIEEFDYSQSLDTIPADIRRMGELMQRTERAEEIASDFEAKLAGLSPLNCRRKPVAIAYGQRGIALGPGTLAHTIIEAAGFENLAAKVGHDGMSPFPLELLVTNPPDLIILPGATPGAPALADEALSHPVLKKLPGTVTASFSRAALWSCGGPFTLDALQELRALAERLTPCKQETGS
jgi:iron complex transport system substrate-binding protein